MTEELTQHQYRAILAISRTTRVGGHLRAVDLGPWRGTTVRALASRGLVTGWWTRRGKVSYLTSVTLTDAGHALVPAALEWEKTQ